MAQQSALSRRLFLLASGGAAGSSVLAGCAASDPNFVHEPLPVPSPPAKMQRLLLWLPPDDNWLNGASVAAKFVSALAPYGVTVETGRSTKLEIDRSVEQKEVIEKFRPTYRLEIDLRDARSSTQGSVSTTAFLMLGVLYRGVSRTPLEKFHYRAQSKDTPRFADQVVEKLKARGYL